MSAHLSNDDMILTSYSRHGNNNNSFHNDTTSSLSPVSSHLIFTKNFQAHLYTDLIKRKTNDL